MSHPECQSTNRGSRSTVSTRPGEETARSGAVTRALAGGLVSLCLFMHSAAEAQTTLSATAGLAGYYRPGQPTPVRVTLDNGGPATRVTVNLFETFGGVNQEGPPACQLPHVRLPAGARQRYFLYPVASRVARAPAVVTLEDSGRELQRLGLTPLPLGADDRFMVALGGGTDSLKSLSGQVLSSVARPYPTLQVGVALPDELPTQAQGFLAADLLYLGDLNADELDPGQQAAVTDWVAAGGTLVVSGGASWARLRHPFYSRLLPVEPNGSQVVNDAAALSTVGGAPGPAGRPFLAARSRVIGDRTVSILKSGGEPLLVRGRYGMGSVLFLAFDPGSPPFREWHGVTRFWLTLARGSAARRNYLDAVLRGEQQEYVGMPGATSGTATVLPPLALAQAPAALSRAELPGFWVVAGFLIAYVIMLVPATYVFLRRGRRLELAWLTSPAIVLLFLLGAYGIGYTIRGGELLLVRAAVVEAGTGSARGQQVTYAGLFSPRRATFRIATSRPGTWLREVDPAAGSEQDAQRRSIVNALEPARFDAFRQEMWDIGFFRASGAIDLGAGFVLERAGGGQRLVNRSPFDLEDCLLVQDQGHRRLDPLPRGSAVALRAPQGSATAPGETGTLLPSAVVSNLSGSAEERRLKEAMLAPFTQMRPGRGPASPLRHPVLVGWAREPAADLLVDGRQVPGRSATLVLIHLPEEWQAP